MPVFKLSLHSNPNRNPVRSRQHANHPRTASAVKSLTPLAPFLVFLMSDSSCVAELCAELHRSLVELEGLWLDLMQSHQSELVGTAMRLFMGHLTMTTSQLHAATVIDEAAANLR